MNAIVDRNITAGATALRFWEIESFFRCPVIGLCLTQAEQERALKKAGVTSRERSPFEMHELLVACAESENQLSRRVEYMLAGKFGSRVSCLHQLDEEGFLRHWRDSFRNGQFIAVFWAAVTRPTLSQGAKREIFGTIHMSMHATAEQHCRDKQRLEYLQNEVAQRDQKIKGMKLAQRQLQKENEDIRRQMMSLRSELQAAARTSDPLRVDGQGRPDHAEDNNPLRSEEADERLRQVDVLEKMLRDAKKVSAELAAELEKQRQDHERFKEEVQEAVREIADKNRCDTTCPAFDLCRKRVLIVGGIARMESFYRSLIEKGGGFFEYHDGHVKGGTKQLENRLKRADIVLCPVNCNSHAACSLVKNLGKKHRKTVHMLANFSLNTISQALAGTDTRESPGSQTAGHLAGAAS